MGMMENLVVAVKQFLGKKLEKCESISMSGVDGDQFICKIIINAYTPGEVVYYVESSDKVQEYRLKSKKFRTLPWIQARHVYTFVVDVVSASDNIDTFYWNLWNGHMRVLFADTGKEVECYIKP